MNKSGPIMRNLTVLIMLTISSTLRAQPISSTVKIQGAVTDNVGFNLGKLWYVSEDSLLHSVKIDKNGDFQFKVISKIYDKHQPEILTLYLVNGGSGEKNFDTVDDLSSGTDSITLFLDSAVINVRMDIRDKEYTITGGYENRVRQEIQKVDWGLMEDLAAFDNIDSVFLKAYSKKLSLLQKYPGSFYAFHYIKSFLRPSLITLKDQVLATIAGFDKKYFDQNSIEGLERKFQKFYGDSDPDVTKFLDIRKFNFEKSDTSIDLLDRFHSSEYILLDIWATWCVPCIKAHKELNQLAAEISDPAKLSVVGLAVMSEKKSWQNYMSDNHLRYDNYWVDWDRYKQKFDYLQINGVPHYLLINTKTGKVMERSILLKNIMTSLKNYL